MGGSSSRRSRDGHIVTPARPYSLFFSRIMQEHTTKNECHLLEIFPLVDAFITPPYTFEIPHSMFV